MFIDLRKGEISVKVWAWATLSFLVVYLLWLLSLAMWSASQTNRLTEQSLASEAHRLAFWTSEAFRAKWATTTLFKQKLESTASLGGEDKGGLDRILKTLIEDPHLTSISILVSIHSPKAMPGGNATGDLVEWSHWRKVNAQWERSSFDKLIGVDSMAFYEKWKYKKWESIKIVSKSPNEDPYRMWMESPFYSQNGKFEGLISLEYNMTYLKQEYGKSSFYKMIVFNETDKRLMFDLGEVSASDIPFDLPAMVEKVRNAKVNGFGPHKLLWYKAGWSLPDLGIKGTIAISLRHTSIFEALGGMMLWSVAGLLLLLAGAWLYWNYLNKRLAKPIQNIHNQLDKIYEGERASFAMDAWAGDLDKVKAGILRLSSKLSEISEVASQIAHGDFTRRLEMVSEKDELSQSINFMLESIKQSVQEESMRNWASEGITELSSVMRAHQDLKQMSEKVIGSLVKYVHMNQGAVFITEEGETEAHTTLRLMGCYAYERTKFADRVIHPGEGILGQVYLEKHYVYLDKVPQNYVFITSGLGMATPTYLLVMPLVHEEKVQGVIELASFGPIEEYKIRFIERFAQLMASTIYYVKINDTTKRLLEQSLEQGEQMKAQEEEMRQNMEELLATQEEMERKQREVNFKTEMLGTLVENMPFPVFVKDHNSKYVLVNEQQCKLLGVEKSFLLGKSDEYFVKDPAEIAEIRRTDSLVLQNRQEVELPTQSLHLKDGTVRHLRTIKIPFENKISGTIHILGVSTEAWGV